VAEKLQQNNSDYKRGEKNWISPLFKANSSCDGGE